VDFLPFVEFSRICSYLVSCREANCAGIRGFSSYYERGDSDLLGPRRPEHRLQPLPPNRQRAQGDIALAFIISAWKTPLLNRVLLAGLHFAAGLQLIGELKGHMRRLSKRLGEAVSETTALTRH